MSRESPRWGVANAYVKRGNQWPKASAAKSRLARYVARRDFAKTAEPTGKQTVRSSSRLRFVIQRHDARRLHYDFSLELDGVFKSWAVTRGPSLDPHDKRLVVEVEDHPLDWPQVRAGLDPKKFTVRMAPALLRKNRPWNDYAKSAKPLRQAIEQLLKTK